MTPLAVDLDGTLLRTDTATEGWIALFLAKPLAALWALTAALEGRAALKRRIEAIAPLDIETLPLREDFVAFLVAERDRGRKLHLVTAADEVLARRIAAHIGLFDSVEGSRPGLNLKGARKAAALRARFPEGFSYCGDSAADLEVWRHARGAVLCGARPSVAARAARLAPIEAVFEDPAAEQPAWRTAWRALQRQSLRRQEPPSAASGWR